MKRVYESEIRNCLETAADLGWCDIPKHRFYRWYDAERINKNAWRDIRERWFEVTEDISEPRKLAIYQSEGRILLLCLQDDHNDDWVAMIDNIIGDVEE